MVLPHFYIRLRFGRIQVTKGASLSVQRQSRTGRCVKANPHNIIFGNATVLQQPGNCAVNDIQIVLGVLQSIVRGQWGAVRQAAIQNTMREIISRSSHKMSVCRIHQHTAAGKRAIIYPDYIACHTFLLFDLTAVGDEPASQSADQGCIVLRYRIHDDIVDIV